MSHHPAAELKHGVAPDAPAPLPAWPSGAMAQVGQSPARVSALAKVKGEPIYASDVVLPGMVHAVLLRSTVAHGRVLGLELAAARAVPGVLRVLGPADIAWPAYPPRDRASVAAEVRFVGEEIGAVVAETEAAAREAARQVVVRYERAPACVTLGQALAAPVLATDAQHIEHGDLGAARTAAEVTINESYSTEAQHHITLEPHGCVAAWEGERLTWWDSNQGGHLIREWGARALGIAAEQLRVVSPHAGGGFGSKITLKPYHLIAAALARELARPVRLFMARPEEFIASHQRAPTHRQISIGARRDGHLCFIDEQISGQAGPCRFLAKNAGGAANGLRLHRVDAVRAELRQLLSHTQYPTPFRGPNVAEDLFCLEQAIDEMAHALKIDPLQLRLANLAEIDLLEGLPYSGKELERCYRLGAQAFGWQHSAPGSTLQADCARGIGMGAVAYDATLYERSVVSIAALPEGRFELRLGLSDIGCGADTVFAQIAAEVLGVSLDRLDLVLGDTDHTPRSIDASNHSRTSAVVGPVVRAAAQRLRSAQEAGADVMGRVFEAERERPPEGVFAAMFGAHFVEVEVNLRSGRVRVLRAVCAHDAGRVLNPRLARGQVQGGFLQGMGMALQEERVLDPRSGRMLNAAMWAYRTPGVLDAPLQLDFVDAGVPDGGNSIGVKGLGEPPLIASGAAIGNALFNAIGVRLRDYPFTPAKVLAALKERHS
jgi:xanthine dehydrogenase YagR molybdenum-binding subunit